jgi:hypothetical protein
MTAGTGKREQMEAEIMMMTIEFEDARDRNFLVVGCGSIYYAHSRTE